MARDAVSPSGPPPSPALMVGREEVGLCPFPRGFFFFFRRENGWDTEYLVPLTWSVGASEKNVYFCKQWVNVKEWGDARESWP